MRPESRATPWGWRVIAVLGLIAPAAAALALSLSPDTLVYPAPAKVLGSIVALQLTSSVAWLAAIAVSRTSPLPAQREIWAWALALRILLFATPPTTSNDWARYVWDGFATLDAESPYAHVPSSPAMEHLRAQAPWALMHHRDLPGVYPPLAQLAFVAGATTARLSSAPALVETSAGADGNAWTTWQSWLRWTWGLKLTFGGAELLALFGLARVLRRRGAAGRSAVLTAAWCPLLAWEIWGQAHVDGLALPFLVAAWHAFERRPAMAAGALAAAALVKPPVLVAAPLFLLHAPSTWLRTGATGALVCVAAYLPLLPRDLPLRSSVAAAFEGMATLGRHWEFNGAIPRVLELIVGYPGRLLGGLFLAASLAGIVVWARRCQAVGEPDRWALAWSLVLFVYLALSRTVYPWYATWLVPFAAASHHPPSLALLASVVCGHAVLVPYASTGVWTLPTWAAWATWSPPALAIGWGFWHQRRRRRSP